MRSIVSFCKSALGVLLVCSAILLGAVPLFIVGSCVVAVAILTVLALAIIGVAGLGVSALFGIPGAWILTDLLSEEIASALLMAEDQEAGNYAG